VDGLLRDETRDLLPACTQEQISSIRCATSGSLT
jgi:hypothetical protein